MEAYDRHTPYNQLPPLPPDQALYMDAEVGAKLVLAKLATYNLLLMVPVIFQMNYHLIILTQLNIHSAIIQMK